jgi:membrane-associated phospholipid phosphatase
MKLNESSNKKLMIFIIILLITNYHYLIQNYLEKYYFKCHFDYNSIKRPLTICSKEQQREKPTTCIGMPSGHVETITIFTSLLYLYKFIPLWISILLIFIISIQRYISNMHSIIQIVAGIIFGLSYVFIYKHFNLSILSFLIIIFIGISLYLSCKI